MPAVAHPDLAGGRQVEPAHQLQQGGLAAPAGADHDHRLPVRDLEVDVVDGADQRLAAAVVLGEAGHPNGGAHRSAPQARSHASSQVRSASIRRTTPSSSSEASDPSGSDIAARCASRSRRTSSRRCAPITSTRVGEPTRRSHHQLEVEVRQVGARPRHVGEPFLDPLPPRGRELVDTTFRSFGRRLAGRGHQTRLLEPTQGHVHLAGVEPGGQGAQRPLDPRPELVAVGRLLGQQRQDHFLLHQHP